MWEGENEKVFFMSARCTSAGRCSVIVIECLVCGNALRQVACSHCAAKSLAYDLAKNAWILFRSSAAGAWIEALKNWGKNTPFSCAHSIAWREMGWVTYVDLLNESYRRLWWREEENDIRGQVGRLRGRCKWYRNEIFTDAKETRTKTVKPSQHGPMQFPQSYQFLNCVTPHKEFKSLFILQRADQ